MATKITPELIEQIATKVTEKVTDKFTESMQTMIADLSKCFAETIGIKVSALEARLTAIETKLSSVSGSLSPVGVSDVKSVAEAVTKTMLELEKQKEEMKTKSVNVIVSGLRSQVDVSDKEMFEDFCENNLTVKPRVVRTRRIRSMAGGTGSVAKLCVTLDSPESVDSLIESARLLRHSDEFSSVYVNRDLTKSQADAAYKARCLRRAGNSGPIGQPQVGLHANP